MPRFTRAGSVSPSLHHEHDAQERHRHERNGVQHDGRADRPVGGAPKNVCTAI